MPISKYKLSILSIIFLILLIHKYQSNSNNNFEYFTVKSNQSSTQISTLQRNESRARAARSPKQVAREKEFSELKKLWLAHSHSSHPFEGQDELEERTANYLIGDADEFIRFRKILSDAEIYETLTTKIECVIAANSSDEGTRQFVYDISKLSNQSYAGICETLGSRISTEEIERTKEKIHGKLNQLYFMMGFFNELAKTDVKLAVQSVVEMMENKESVRFQSYIQFNKILKKIPPTLNILEIESLLPLSKSSDHSSNYYHARQKLFYEWADRDPAAAANYVIDHPDQYNPKLIEEVISATVLKNISGMKSVAQWVNYFPKGKYQDQAIEAAIRHWRFEDLEVANELADKLSNEKLKKEYKKTLVGKQEEGG